MNLLRRLAAAALVALLLGHLALPNAHAKAIAWGMPQTITGDSDVDTTGSLVYAYNVGSSTAVSSTVTVNGVAFQPFPITNFPATNTFTFGSVTISESPGFLFGYSLASASSPYGALTASYQLVLDGRGRGGHSRCRHCQPWRAFIRAAVPLSVVGKQRGKRF